MAILEDGLDEMAARAFQGLPLRVATTICTAAVALFMVPWQICVAWLVADLASETASYWVTRPQSLGMKASAKLRLGHLATLIIGCLLWTFLGGVFWTNGTPEGMVAGMIVWLAVIFFAQNNAYQSTTGFVIGAGIPAIGMLGIMVFGPSSAQNNILPIIGLTLIAFGFVADGVMRSLGIRMRMRGTQAQLMASEAQYRMLADNITDVVWLNRFDGSRVYVSPSVKRLLGYDSEHVFDNNFGMVHPDDIKRVERQIRRTVNTGRDTTIECRMIHKLGHTVWMETHIGVVHGSDGQAEPILIAVSRNIDTRKAMESELVAARRHAEDSAAAKSEFLANMTHELRTPLNAIIGFSGVLKGSPRLSSEDARHVYLINEASDSLLDLVNGVLDFSKLEAGAVELEALAFDPARIGRTACDLLAEQASAKGLDLRLHVEGESGPLIGDEARLRRVLLNFLSNAVKFTKDGAVTVTVRQSAASDNQSRLYIEVADSGIGVSADQIDHLFDRFTQADATVSRQHGGTGLGLAICKKTLDLMGGKVGCNSRPGEGSTFWLELVLPRSALAPADDAASIADASLEVALKVLLVEDVAVNRELVSALLGPFDVDLVMAENGLEAVEAMGRDQFDLVLMDVQMPVMDGLTATRAIRALPTVQARMTPIIAMTANVLPDHVKRCLEAGMDDHIGKPISPASLLGALSRWSLGREAGAMADRENVA